MRATTVIADGSALIGRGSSGAAVESDAGLDVWTVRDGKVAQDGADTTNRAEALEAAGLRE